MRQPDRDLVLAVARGQDEAFDALRERYYGSVLGFLTALVGDDAAAEAAEATFTTALAELRTSQPERFKSWLFAEAHRTGLALRNGRTANPRLFRRRRRSHQRPVADRHRRHGPGR